jgi:hypothetical protein
VKLRHCLVVGTSSPSLSNFEMTTLNFNFGANISLRPPFTLEIRAKKLGANFEHFRLVVWPKFIHKC